MDEWIAWALEETGIEYVIEDSRGLPDPICEAQASREAWVLDFVTDRGPTPDDFRADRPGATETSTPRPAHEDVCRTKLPWPACVSST